MQAHLDLDFARRHWALVVNLATRLAPLPPELVQRHRRKLDKNLLAQNPFLAKGDAGPSLPREDPQLEERWRGFVLASADPPGDGRVQAFVASCREVLDASYVSGLRMCGRDWEAEHERGWTYLSRVGALDWSEAILVALADVLDFRALSANPGVPWTEALLTRFADCWAWDALARNEALPWSESLVARFPQLPLAPLSSNAQLPWTAAFIERHAAALDWSALARNRGVPWTPELATRFATRLSWQALAENPSYPGTEALVAEHAETLDWEALARSWSFPWTPALLRRFGDRIPWRTLSAEASIWTVELLEEHGERVEFGAKGVSRNMRLAWSREIFERFEERLDRREVGRNPAVWSGVFEPVLSMSALEELLTTMPADGTGRASDPR